MIHARKIFVFLPLLLILAGLPCLLHAQTTVALSASPNPSRFGAPVLLSATVTPATANGRVTFYDGVTVLGTKPLVSGAASISTILLPSGSRKLKAYYAGDASNAAATSNVVSQTVNAQPAAGFINPAPSMSLGPLYAVADFNGDGKADLLAIVNATQSLQVLLGDGAGNFQVSFTGPAVGGLPAAVVGDFNGDGIPDVAYLIAGPSSVNIVLGKGDGTFQAPVTFAIPHLSVNLAAGDFNGDGKVDLVVADPSAGAVILLGNGDGTLQPPVVYATAAAGNSVGNPGQAHFVVVGDFNGDGKADIAAANLQGNVGILLGRGDGTFQPAIQVAAQNASTLFLADFNGDGKADLVTSSGQVLLGNGDGTFRILTPSSFTPTLGIGDFNGDGKTDLVVLTTINIDNQGDSNLGVLLGNGDGTFQPPAFNVVAGPSNTLLVGDFNSDGRTDIAYSTNGLGLFLGTTVTLTPAGTPQTGALGQAFPAPLQVTVKDGGVPRSGVVVTFVATLLPGRGPSVTLSSNTATTDANGVASVTAIANNGLGTFPVTATALGISVQFALTNATVAANSLTASPTTPQAALVGSAFPKLLQVTALDASGAPVSGVDITFTAPPQAGASAALSFGQIVTDANGVASVRAIANNIAGSYTVTATTGGLTATFSLTNLPPTAVPVTLTSSSNPSTFGSPVTLTAIVNPAGNGKVTFFDGLTVLGTAPISSFMVHPAGVASLSTILLSAGTHQLTAYYRDEVNAVAGTSNVVTQTVNAVAGGAFTAQTPMAIAPAGSVVTGDFNHDGKVDLAFVQSFADIGSSVIVLLGKGDGSFQSPVRYSGQNESFGHSIVAADFDGDGNTDLATDAGVGLLLGKGDGTFVPGSFQSNGSPFAAGDFNGDGKPDIISAFAATFFFPSAISADPRLSPRQDNGGRQILVYLLPGNGDGTFGFQTPLASLPAPSSTTVVAGLAVADFNGDGKADVVVLPSDAGPIIIRNGTPASLSLPGFSSGKSLVVGDFNGDGKQDLAVGGISGANTPTTWILLGKGDGTFQPAVSYPLGAVAVSGDFNGDGFTDLVVTNASGNMTGVLYGKGDGTFQQGPALSAGVPLAVSDFNGDGRADILTATENPYGSGTTTVLLGATASTGGGGTPSSATATGGTPQSIVVDTAFPSPLQVSVKDGNGLPVLGATVTFTAPSTGASAVLSSPTALTNSFGVASVTAVANHISGAYTVTATVGGLSTSFSLTNRLGGSADLALGRTAMQSSTLPGYATTGAASAVDGNTDGQFFDGSVSHTNQEANAWWQVDLGASASINTVVVWNRTDCCSTRLSEFWVFVSNTPFLPTDTPLTLQNRPGTFNSHQTIAPNPSTTITFNGVQGQYVRVQLTGTDFLSLAEVQVFGTGGAPAPTNVALGKLTSQSSTLPGSSGPAVAVDGNTDGNFFDGSVTHTNLDTNAWWQVDLGGSSTVNSITLWNRTDCCGDRLSDYWVFVSDTPFLSTDTPATLQNRTGTFGSHQTTAPNPSTSIPVGAKGRYVRVQLSGINNLSLAEVQVLGTGGSPAPANLALGRATSQSSTLPSYATSGSGGAVDGNTDGNFFDGSVTHTNLDTNAWWQVDLGASAAIGSVVVWNRTDCCGTRLSDYWVFVSDTPFLFTDTPATLQNRAGTFASHQTAAPNPSTTIAAVAQGRYVRVQLSGTNYLSLAEVQVLGQ
jgi:hypothetical protein